MENIEDRLEDLERTLGLRDFEVKMSPEEHRERIERLIKMMEAFDKEPNRMDIIRSLAEAHNLKFYTDEEVETWWSGYKNLWKDAT